MTEDRRCRQFTNTARKGPLDVGTEIAAGLEVMRRHNTYNTCSEAEPLDNKET